MGSLLLASTDLGLVRVAYPCEDHDTVLGALAERVGPRILQAPSRLDTVALEIEEYFAGRATARPVGTSAGHTRSTRC